MRFRWLAIAVAGWAYAPVAAAQHAAVDVEGGPPGFIVALEPGADPERVARDHGVQPDFVYRHAIVGFAGEIPDAARQGLFRDGRVRRIERDGVAQTAAVASWGIDRIDQRSLPLDSTYQPVRSGRGVTAYVVDSGIRYSHTELLGRARFGIDVLGGDGSDCSGHGTHVAGTIGGRTAGVAREVELVSARVLDCSGLGTTSGVIAALDWVATDAVGPSVVNLSLVAPASTSLDDAVRRLADTGVVVVAAAGNANKDACLYSPARSTSALAVGATDRYDARWSLSNWGSCVDVFAPGSQIVSASASDDSSFVSMSGTSMASPHTAGVAAAYLEADPYASPLTVFAAITSGATPGVVTNSLSERPNLLYANLTGGSTPPPPPENTPPVAEFAWTCTELACSFTDRSTDSDGSVTAFSWTFGDGATSTVRNPSYTFGAPGTWTVALTVTDDLGATHRVEHAVTVTQPTATILDLWASATKVKGKRATDLRWSGATTSSVDVYRNGVKVVTTNNDGSHLDSVRGGGTYTYRLCEASRTVCSPDRTVTY